MRAPFEHVRSKGIWSLRDVTLDEEKNRRRRERGGRRAGNTTRLSWCQVARPTSPPPFAPHSPEIAIVGPKRAAGLPPCAVLVGFLSVHVGFFPFLDVGNLVSVKKSGSLQNLFGWSLTFAVFSIGKILPRPLWFLKHVDKI